MARRAGTKPDTTVAMIPTAKPAMIVRGSSGRLVPPSSRPKAPSSARKPGAAARPRAIPTIEASTPITRVSASTDRRTCPREAPSVRSSANSFDRCATVTANVLKIRNPPTSSAMPANTSSAIRMKPSASERSLADLSACSLPVRTVNSLRGSSAAIAALSSSGDVPLAAATEMSS